MTGTRTSRLADPSLTHQELRDRRAQGSLPYAELPDWVASARKSPSGLTMLPQMNGFDFATAASRGLSPIMFTLCASLLFFLFINNPQSFQQEAKFSLATSLLIGSPVYLFMLYLWIGEDTFRKMIPQRSSAVETAKIEVDPGETTVVMIRLRPGQERLQKVELRFRERWYEPTESNERWYETVEHTQELPITQQGPTLAVVNLEVPYDAEASYDALHYKLEWILAITHQPRNGRPRTDEFALWVTERSVFRSQ